MDERVPCGSERHVLLELQAKEMLDRDIAAGVRHRRLRFNTYRFIPRDFKREERSGNGHVYVEPWCLRACRLSRLASTRVVNHTYTVNKIKYKQRYRD